MEEGNKKKIVQVILFIVTFAVAFFGTKYVMSRLKSEKPKEVKESIK
ncbi:hypothetical protein [Flavobacterium sp. XGLA_31]